MPSERFCRAAWWLCWRSSCVSRLGLGGLLCVLTSWAVAQDEGFAWIADGRPNQEAHQAVSILLGAAADGLEPDDYGAGGLEQALAEAEALDAAGQRALEAALTRAMTRYLADLHGGRVDLRVIQPGQRFERDNGFAPAEVLQAALAAGRLPEAVREAAPAQPDYPGLRRALGWYRELAEDPLRGGLWQTPLPPLLTPPT